MAALGALAGAVLSRQEVVGPEGVEIEGLAPRPAFESTPAVAATFLRDSYRPGSWASLVLWSPEARVSVQVFRAGRHDLAPSDAVTMRGIAVSGVRRLVDVPAHRPVRVRIGRWPSGLYFARLQSQDRVGFAPFVVRPSRLGAHRVLLVMPTFTWQAYNFRDDDGDGHGDTWYSGPDVDTAPFVRPFMARGVPPHFRTYDLPFLNWLSRTGKTVDMFSDTDLAGARSAAALARAYDLIVFPGHHEYVTEREYGLIEGYRDLGGHLIFLSANNFYWKITRRNRILTRHSRWRKLGRPESALIGVEFLINDNGAHQGPWVVRDTRSRPWLFGDTGLAVGDSFGHGGIEIDHTTEHSPPGTTVLAEMPDLLGPGRTAQMTYYETAAGAKVFAAGAFTLGGARNPVSCHVLQHLWDHLTSAPAGGCPPSPPERAADCPLPSAHALKPDDAPC